VADLNRPTPVVEDIEWPIEWNRAIQDDGDDVGVDLLRDATGSDTTVCRAAGAVPASRDAHTADPWPLRGTGFDGRGAAVDDRGIMR
jgi:hypothetical protein